MSKARNDAVFEGIGANERARRRYPELHVSWVRQSARGHPASRHNVRPSGPTRSTVTGTPTKDIAQILVQQQAPLTGLVSVLAGATANALLIEQ